MRYFFVVIENRDGYNIEKMTAKTAKIVFTQKKEEGLKKGDFFIYETDKNFWELKMENLLVQNKIYLNVNSL